MSGADLGNSDGGRDVIARFSGPFFVGGVLATGLCTWILGLVWQEVFVTPHPGTQRHDRALFDLVYFAMAAWLAIAGARLCYFAIANRGVALWEEAGRLVYADKKKLDVPIGDIKTVAICYYSRYAFSRFDPMLCFRFKDGGSALLRMNPLAGSRSVIIEALEARLGLTIENSPS
jgi:hypothetical protein